MKKVNFAIIFFVCLWVLCVSAIVSNAQTSVKTDSKGVKYPVYKSVNGKLFYTRVSKAGNKYNVYITVSK